MNGLRIQVLQQLSAKATKCLRSLRKFVRPTIKSEEPINAPPLPNGARHYLIGVTTDQSFQKVSANWRGLAVEKFRNLDK